MFCVLFSFFEGLSRNFDWPIAERRLFSSFESSNVWMKLERRFQTLHLEFRDENDFARCSSQWRFTASLVWMKFDRGCSQSLKISGRSRNKFLRHDCWLKKLNITAEKILQANYFQAFEILWRIFRSIWILEIDFFPVTYFLDVEKEQWSGASWQTSPTKFVYQTRISISAIYTKRTQIHR